MSLINPISQIFDGDLFPSLLHLDERFYTPVFINIIDDTTSNCLKVPTISLWRVSWIIVSSNGFNNVSNRKAISSFVFHHGPRRSDFCDTSVRVFMVEGVKSWLGSHCSCRQFLQRSNPRTPPDGVFLLGVQGHQNPPGRALPKSRQRCSASPRYRRSPQRRGGHRSHDPHEAVRR